MPAHIPQSFIKNIAIEIRNGYKLSNTPFSVEDPKNANNSFIGRTKQKQKFLKFLKDSNKGIFLVTGERGIGKTSFVNHVIKIFKSKEKKIDAQKEVIDIHLTLSQNQPKEIDILWLMVNSIFDKYKKTLKKAASHENSAEQHLNPYSKTRLSRIKGWLYFSIIACVIPLFIIWRSHERWKILYDNKSAMAESSAWLINYWLIYAAYGVLAGAFLAVSYFFWKFMQHKNIENQKEQEGAFNRIKRLRERCIASLTEEAGTHEQIKVEGIAASLLSGKGKKIRQYSIASNKEIEYELKQFLEEVQEEKKKKLQFIFVFDELDKVEPVVSSTYLYEDLEKFQKVENANPHDFRDRKQAIINIIAGLKNFFTTAEARFIFIAGHEMFDASLADIADRQSSISSIFTFTFNIESFLKEKHVGSEENNVSLSMAIEGYLKLVLFGKLNLNPENTYKTFLQHVKDGFTCSDSDNNQSDPAKTVDDDLALSKALFTLQKFIDYLTYRTNGSPKKLIKIVHEFVIIEDEKYIEKKKAKTVFARIKDPELRKPDEEGKTKFLYFNYNNQYRIGFISYLYRPFLIQHGRSYKSYSDNIIVSTPYLFDHLLKFHPFGFSLSNLELMPEVLSTSKNTSLHEHIANIIEYLGETHIRKTEIGLFDYKFYSRTLNEIAYISKLFEEEAAAFNFTLDESYMVKIYLRSKIKELRNVLSKFLGDPKIAGMQQIFSLSHLNGKLGDIHFFDQEYDDAIVAYSDAIRPINTNQIQEIGMRDFITLIRNKLKLGLCFEKMNSYDEALAFYSDCCQDAKRFIMQKLTGLRDVESQEDVKIDDFYNTSSLNDVLQIVIQGFLATIILEEKMGVEGITTQKLGISLGNFLKLAEKVNKKTLAGRNNLIITNALLLAGKLFYFKNTAANINFAASNDKDDLISDINLIDIKNAEYWNFPVDFKMKLIRLSDAYDNILSPFKINENRLRRTPTTALYMYIMGICEVMTSRLVDPDLFNEITEHKNISYKLLENLNTYLGSNDERLLGYHHRYIATFLSSIGDALWAMYIHPKYKAINYDEIFDAKKIGDFINNKDVNDFDYYLKSPDPDVFSLSDIFRCFYLSSKYFIKYGRSVSASYQYRKILYVLKTVIIPVDDKYAREIFLELLDQKVVKPVLEIVSKNGGHADRHLIKKGKALVNEENWYYVMNNVSNHSDSREVILLYNYIRLKLGHVFHEMTIQTLISHYNSIGTQYGRIAELDFYAKYVYTAKIEKIRVKELTKTDGQYDIIRDQRDTYNKYAIDYLYSMLTILRIQKIYGNDFVIGHSSFAYTHFRLACFLRDYQINDKIKDGLIAVMDKGSYSSLDASFHFQLAKDLYSKAKQLHTAGNEYKKTIADMVYLEDDFNDNAYHFGASLNRYLMINNDFDNNIKICGDEIAKDPYYKHSAYYNEENLSK